MGVGEANGQSPPSGISRNDRFVAALTLIEKEARERGRTVPRRAVAINAHVTSPAVTAWFKGQQVPRADKLDAIAEAYAGGDIGLFQDVRHRLYVAAGAELSPPILRSSMERARGNGQIRIGILDYPPISTFLTEMLSSFSKYADFNAAITRTPSVPSLTTRSDLASPERFDIVSGIFATPMRAADFRFIETPLAMGVNALTFDVLKKKLEDRNWTDLHADDPEKRDSRRRRILPIVNPGEAGHQFAKQVLGFKDHEMRQCEYGARSFIDQLVQALPTADDRIPVVIADELVILNIYAELIDAFASGELDCAALGLPEVLLKIARAPEDADDTLRKQTTKDLYPIFNIPICVGKGDDEWFSYLREAWSIFIRSNVRYVAARYMDLHDQLNERIDEMVAVVENNPSIFERGDKGASTATALAADINSTWKGMISGWLFDNYCLEWERIIEISNPAAPEGSLSYLIDRLRDDLKNLEKRLTSRAASPGNLVGG